MRSVVIVGPHVPYLSDRKGAEIWCVNRAYRTHPDCDRLYFLDPIDCFEPRFVEEVARLDVPVFTRSTTPKIPASRTYPIDAVIRKFGFRYFTSTVAYMIAHAIYEHRPTIVLHGLYADATQNDYLEQRACVEFWLGIAYGRGIGILATDSQLLAPVLYGYEGSRPDAKRIAIEQSGGIAGLYRQMKKEAPGLIRNDPLALNAQGGNNGGGIADDPR